MMQALQISQHGNPLDVLELINIVEPPAPAQGEVLVQMLYSPINPYDLRSIRGIVPSPALPSLIGAEGVGKILVVGENVTHVSTGDLVHLPIGYFGWRERLIVPSAPLFPLPADADPQQLSMLRVNPPTDALLLSEFGDLKSGDWIIQNAANSAVGRCVIAFARERGIKTVNLVRRESAVADVIAAGGDIVLVEGPGLPARVAEATGNAAIRVGFDGVGAVSMLYLTGCITPRGTLAVYSAMSEQAGMASSLDTIFRDISICGFWLAYPRLHTSGRYAASVMESAALIGRGKLHIPIAAAFALKDFEEAIRNVGQGGKVLLKMA